MNEYKKDSLNVIWIGHHDRVEKLVPFAESHGLDRVGFDETNSVADNYGVRYGAAILFIDSLQVARKRIAIGFSESSLRENVKRLIRLDKVNEPVNDGPKNQPPSQPPS